MNKGQSPGKSTSSASEGKDRSQVETIKTT